MKDHKRPPFRSRIFVPYLLLIGALVLLPITGILIAKQDSTDALPAEPDMPELPDVVDVAVAPLASVFAVQAPVHEVQGLAGQGLATPFAVELPQTGDDLLGIAGAGIYESDPMESFVAKIRDAQDDKAKQEAVEQAKAALEKHYDKYIGAYEKQVDEMESRLQKLRDQLNKRKEAKDRLVGLKLEMITSQAEGIGWPEANDALNAPRFPRGMRTIWRTAPATPASPPNPLVPRTVPAPGAAAQPSRYFFGSKAPTAETLLPRLATAPQTARTYSAAHDTVTFSGKLDSAAFKTFFERGIELLEEGEYGEFLDRYLEPGEFRKELKSTTLDELAEKFENKSAKSVLTLFRSAMEQPIKSYDAAKGTLTWEPIEVDGETRQLTLLRGEQGQWYLSIGD